MRRLVWGALLYSVGSIAMALPPSPGPQVELYISGSSAQDEALENLIRLAQNVPGAPALCQSGTLDIYRGTIDGTASRVFYCKTSRSVAGVPPGRY
jgi:hypothetical protein